MTFFLEGGEVFRDGINKKTLLADVFIKISKTMA